MMQILVVKKERSEDDELCLREHMNNVRSEWNEEWGGQVEKLRRFGESDAKREQLERTKQWMDNTQQTNLACALAYFDDSNLMVNFDKIITICYVAANH